MGNEKVAIYCRLSTEDLDKIGKGDDSESIQNQKLLLMDYAMNHNFSIHKIYSDDDYSGLDRDRPQFNQMLDDAENGLFNIILCKTQSRFTRDMEMVEKYIHGLFGIWGIRFISVVDNVDTNVKGNKKARQIYGLINEWYCEDLSENIRAVFKKKMQDGQFLGSFAPYGYMKDPSNRHKLVIDEPAASVVKEIFELYLQGYGSARIANILTERGLLPPSAYKAEQGLNFKNPNSAKYSEYYGVWSYNTIKRILQSPTYIGQLIQGRERKVSYKSKKVIIAPKDEWIVIENNHSPIIDPKAFYTVQNLISKKRNTHMPINGYKGSKSSHVLASKVVCLDCGNMLHRGGTSRDKKTHYLRCKLAYKTKSTACTPHTITLNELIKIAEEKIQSLINTFIGNEKNVELILDDFASKSDARKEIEQKEKELISCESKIKEVSKVIAMAYTDKVKGILSETDFINMKQVYDSDLNSYQDRKNRLEKEIQEIGFRYKSMKNIADLLTKYTSFETLTHEIVNDFIDTIQVGEKNQLGDQQVVINWLF